MLGLLPGLIYGRSAKSIDVDQFMESTAQVQLELAGRVEIVQRTGYPTHERVLLEIRPELRAHFELKIRIPSWCAAPSLSVNAGGVSDLRPGTYASVQRTWNTGDRVELSLPMEANWVRGEHGNTGHRVLTRGPLIYVADGVWQHAEVGQKLAKAASGRGLQELKTPDHALRPFYRCAGS